MVTSPSGNTASFSQQMPSPSQAKEIPPLVERAFANWMKGNFGTPSLHGIAPKDSLEGVLGVQMVAVHSFAMECMRRAAIDGQTDFGVDVYVSRATKLLRTFANLTEALNRYRDKGEQKMTVEHVHVYPGGKAIVGQVEQKNIEIRDRTGHD